MNSLVLIALPTVKYYHNNQRQTDNNNPETNLTHSLIYPQVCVNKQQLLYRVRHCKGMFIPYISCFPSD